MGPERVINGFNGVRVVLTAYWSDDDGVCVNVDAGDGVLPGPIAEAVALAMIQLAALPAPALPELVSL